MPSFADWEAHVRAEAAEMRDDALTVPCPFCRQPVGEPCFNKSSGLMVNHFPAHLRRLREVGY